MALPPLAGRVRGASSSVRLSTCRLSKSLPVPAATEEASPRSPLRLAQGVKFGHHTQLSPKESTAGTQRELWPLASRAEIIRKPVRH